VNFSLREEVVIKSRQVWSATADKSHRRLDLDGGGVSALNDIEKIFGGFLDLVAQRVQVLDDIGRTANRSRSRDIV